MNDTAGYYIYKARREQAEEQRKADKDYLEQTIAYNRAIAVAPWCGYPGGGRPGRPPAFERGAPLMPDRSL